MAPRWPQDGPKMAPSPAQLVRGGDLEERVCNCAMWKYTETTLNIQIAWMLRLYFKMRGAIYRDEQWCSGTQQRSSCFPFPPFGFTSAQLASSAQRSIAAGNSVCCNFGTSFREVDEVAAQADFQRGGSSNLLLQERAL